MFSESAPDLSFWRTLGMLSYVRPSAIDLLVTYKNPVTYLKLFMIRNPAILSVGSILGNK